MGNYNFHKDLSVEKETIKEIVNKLKEGGMEVISTGNTNDGDIEGRFPKTGSTEWIEVKEDFGKNKQDEWTGNVALEFMSRGKASGVLVGKSKYWIYKVHHKDGIRFLLFKRKDLIALIEKKKYKFIANGGDKGSNTMLFLFSLSVFSGAGKEIWM